MSFYPIESSFCPTIRHSVDLWLTIFSTFNFSLSKAAAPGKGKESTAGLGVWRSRCRTQLHYWGLIRGRSFTLDLPKISPSRKWFSLPSILFFQNTYHNCLYLTSDSCSRVWWVRAQRDSGAVLLGFKSWLPHSLPLWASYLVSLCLSFLNC